jgi:uncharacterized membrane protein YhhN
VGAALRLSGVYWDYGMKQRVDWRTHRTLPGLLLFIAIGLAWIWDRIPRTQYPISIFFTLLFLLWPAYLIVHRFPEQDRSAPPAKA